MSFKSNLIVAIALSLVSGTVYAGYEDDLGGYKGPAGFQKQQAPKYNKCKPPVHDDEELGCVPPQQCSPKQGSPKQYSPKQFSPKQFSPKQFSPKQSSPKQGGFSK